VEPDSDTTRFVGLLNSGVNYQVISGKLSSSKSEDKTAKVTVIGVVSRTFSFSGFIRISKSSWVKLVQTTVVDA
jgi:hypothetical protein